MLQVEKIINAGNCELVLKWSDGRLQTLKAAFLQKRCPCVNCTTKGAEVKPDVKIQDFRLKARMGVQVVFSSGCQSGIYSFNEMRSWLNDL